MRKRIIGGVVAVGIVASAGVAWAVLGGTVTAPDVITGLANGGGSNSCQSGGLTFTLPSPTWDNSTGGYVISSVSFSGLSTACVNLGTADVVLNLTTGNSSTSIATGTALNAQASSGTINLGTPLDFDIANNANYHYLVRNA